MKGHSYYLYDPAHVDGAVRVDADGRGGSYLVGDSLGLSQPLTAEGILPAVVSGRLLAQAILAGAPSSYPARLRAHPVIEDYRRIHGLRLAAGSIGSLVARSMSRSVGRSTDRSTDRSPARSRVWASRIRQRAVTSGFAWMFSGARLPAPRFIDMALNLTHGWLSSRHEPGRAS